MVVFFPQATRKMEANIRKDKPCTHVLKWESVLCIKM